MNDPKPNDICPKCRLGVFDIGPTHCVDYSRPDQSAELLAYACGICGYQIFTPCADAEGAER